MDNCWCLANISFKPGLGGAMIYPTPEKAIQVGEAWKLEGGDYNSKLSMYLQRNITAIHQRQYGEVRSYIHK